MVADDVDGSASGGGWIGLKQDMGEIIGEADANLLLVVLLGPTGDDAPRKVAAAAMVCGRRLVFLVTHISVQPCGSSRTSIGKDNAKATQGLFALKLSGEARSLRVWSLIIHS